jgi:hypothetical protein
LLGASVFSRLVIVVFGGADRGIGSGENSIALCVGVARAMGLAVLAMGLGELARVRKSCKKAELADF